MKLLRVVKPIPTMIDINIHQRFSSTYLRRRAAVIHRAKEPFAHTKVDNCRAGGAGGAGGAGAHQSAALVTARASGDR
ncbi:hypothetical protein EVAR_34006_1 [Eumeta japonica]|uniref:Uncharacterized protein n=1 Tax=Eumeta variegata TaxID=151549 RepID=A0A4C1VUN6_EUMVA|nr:hypothetical protein EVAR_34006_1 [Eumeta japonica]